MPTLGVAHPIRIGKSLRQASSGAYSILALKFPHIMDDTDTNAMGTITRCDDKLTVELPTIDGNSTNVFSGLRKVEEPKSGEADYILVFYDGEYWLERIADYGHFLRYDGTSSEPMDVEQEPGNRFLERPDSWMSPVGSLSGSPVTPERNSVDDYPAEVSQNNFFSRSPARNDFYRKNVSGIITSGTDNNFSDYLDNEKCSGPENMVTVNTSIKTAGAVSMPKQTLRTEGPTPHAKGNDSPLKDAEIIEEIVEVEEVTEDDVTEEAIKTVVETRNPDMEEYVDDDEDRRSKGSSLEASDSDSESASASASASVSASGSASGSALYTDSSSQEN